jgi:hypothetical protein
MELAIDVNLVFMLAAQLTPWRTPDGLRPTPGD